MIYKIETEVRFSSFRIDSLLTHLYEESLIKFKYNICVCFVTWQESDTKIKGRNKHSIFFCENVVFFSFALSLMAELEQCICAHRVFKIGKVLWNNCELLFNCAICLTSNENGACNVEPHWKRVTFQKSLVKFLLLLTYT